MVYVISQSGKPLMPTNNHGKVRKLLKNKKAKVVDYKPFTIQLLYKTSEYVKPLVLGLDTGRDNISISVVDKEDGHVTYSGVLTTRNRDIPKLMGKKAMHRNSRRRHRRQRKIRIAKRNKTYYQNVKHIKEVGTKETIPVKYITKKEARFSNRKRRDKWLTPTARQLLESHLNYLNKVTQILPIKEVVVEYAKFDIHKLKNPSVKGKEYQEGDLYGYLNMKAFITARQEGKCLLCRKEHVENLHHLVERKNGGSDSHLNLAGLCKKCHDKVHKSELHRNKVANLMKGTKKEFDSTSILNIIMPRLLSEIKAMFGEDNVSITYGYITKGDRISYKLEKSHHNDSYLIALTKVENFIINQKIEPYEYMQFRRHNRQFLDALRDRYYKDGKITVARNRNKKTDQKEPSLSEYREKLLRTNSKKETDKLISGLKVVPSIKRYKTSIKDIPIPYGSTVLYQGERHIVSGVLNKGATLRLVDRPKENIGLKKVRLLKRNTGIVCL